MFVKLATTFLFGVAVGLSVEENSSFDYEGSKIYSAVVSDEHQAAQLLHLGQQGKIQFVSDPFRDSPDTLVFVVGERNLQELHDVLLAFNIPTTVVVENLQNTLDQENGGPRAYNEPPQDGPFDFTTYPSYEQIIKHIDYYINDPLRGKHMSKFVIGLSYKKKEIIGVKFDRGNTGNKSVIFIECGIHPREWIAISTCSWMIHEFAFNAAKHSDILNNYEVRIVPATNPDGYANTKIHRFWRGNVRPSDKNPKCKGVDINRNFDVGKFCGPGTSDDPCDEQYCGDGPFSEPESQALRDAVWEVRNRLEYYISLHAYGQMWMFPYSYTTHTSKDHARLLRKATAGAEAIRAYGGKRYKTGTIANTLYAVTGSSVDWAYEQGAKNAFVLELPPLQEDAKGGLGFIVMPKEIKPIAEETFVGLKAMLATQ